MVGQTLGRYRLLEQIGAGGMGVVYRARDIKLDRDVALKVLPAGSLTPGAADRFRAEVRALSRLSHPNIATLHDFDRADDIDFFVMEYIRGVTIDARVAKGPMPEAEVTSLGVQIVAALDDAHEHGIVHRDLKPANIMITAKGQVKILDFGVAKVMQAASTPEAVTAPNVTLPDGVVGTLPYMAPEQVRGGAVDRRADIWATGAVLYEMATGTRPFPDADQFSLMSAILHRALPPPRELAPQLTPAFEQILVKTLDKDPERRYQTARELLVDLQRLDPSAVRSAFVTPAEPARPATRRLRTRILWAGVAVAAIVGAVFAVRSWRTPAGAVAKQVVLVGDFENRTGDPVFDQTLRELMNTSLEQSSSLTLYPSSLVRDALQRMQRPATARIDDTVGREICSREGLQAVVLGSITRMGNGYVLMARALSPAGATLASAQQTVPSVDRVPSALDAVAGKLRTDLGESLKSVREHSAELAQVTSGSLDAVRYFTLGKDRLYGGQPAEAIAYFTKAIEIDGGFAMAHEYLGVAYTHINDMTRAFQEMHAASRLADRVTEPERLKILADYNQSIGNYEEAINSYQVLADLRPRDPAPLLNLGSTYAAKFDFASAITATEKALKLRPLARLKANLVLMYTLAGDNTRALDIAHAVLAELPQDLQALDGIGQAHLAAGRLAEARKVFTDMIGAGGELEIEGRMRLADLAWAAGRYGEARQQLDAAQIAAEKGQNLSASVRCRVALVELAADTGGRVDLTAASLPDLSFDPTLLAVAGRTAARSRAPGEAAKFRQALAALTAGRATPQLKSLVAIVDAAMAIGGNPAGAVTAAESATAYEHSTFAHEMLAEAYAAAGRGADAIREYERVIARANERAESFDTPAFHHVVAIHYRLGVLYDAAGQHDRAESHLKAFLSYRAEADTNAVLDTDARARLSRPR